MNQTTERKLIEALERIKNGNPINIDNNRKLSFSSVEDEALLSRSLSRHYPEVFGMIKKEIEISKSKKTISMLQLDENKRQSSKDEILILKEQIKLLKQQNSELLIANVSLAERIVFLNNKQNN